MVQGRITKENQKFFLDSEQIPGVQTYRAEYSTNAQPLKYLSAQSFIHAPQGTSRGGVSLNANLISDDLILPYTGDFGCNGFLLQSRDDSTENFSFISGYLTSYTTRYTFGQLPDINAEFLVLGDIGRVDVGGMPNNAQVQLNTIYTGKSNLVMKIPGPGGVSINLDDFTTNRVIGYDISIAVARNAVYKLGQREPAAVRILYPITMTCNFQIEMNDYVAKSSFSYPCAPKVQNLNISVRSFAGYDTIVSYSMPDALLTSESTSASAKGNRIINAEYTCLRKR